MAASYPGPATNVTLQSRWRPDVTVLATRAGDRGRLVAAFRKLAEAHLTGPARA